MKITWKERIKRPGYKVIFGVFIILFLYHFSYNDLAVPVQSDCASCHNRAKAMTEYFRKAGNKTPEEMAIAVLATKSPRLLAAIATKGEKNTPHTVRRGGYKNRHAGAWQVNKDYWGEVPVDPVRQALQAESILVELTNEMPIRKALSVYGGDSTNKYQRTVLAELVNVP